LFDAASQRLSKKLFNTAGKTDRNKLRRVWFLFFSFVAVLKNSKSVKSLSLTAWAFFILDFKKINKQNIPIKLIDLAYL
jgi:hypothetical protein